MALNLKWAPSFQQFLSGFENKYSLAQSHLSPIGYALSQKIIPADQYLRWAQIAYQLPVVSDDYFNAHLPSVDDWKSWKTEFNWTEEIVPIGIWDGHLLIACLEVPARFPASLYPIFLLSDFKNTQRTFQFYKNSDKGSESAKKLKDMIQQPEAFEVMPQETFIPTAIQPAPLQTASQQTPSHFDPFELSDEPAAEEIIEENSKLHSHDEPVGLSFNISTDSLPPSVPSKTKVTAAPAEFSFENLDKLSTPQKEELSLKFTNVSFNSADSQKKTTKEVTSTTNTGMTSSKQDVTLHTAFNTTVLPSPIQNEINKGLPYFIAIKKDNPTNFESLTQGHFTKSSNLFEKFILIAIDPSELNAVPVSWSDNISPRSKDLEKLDLTEPSIFKTVASTLKSYHGYIVLNESNEKFFEFWNEGQVPGNITMVPLIVRNKLVGMWMGLGESNTYNWNTLRQMESKGKELSEAFTNLHKDNAVEAA